MTEEPRVLLLDNHLLGIVKPAGLLSQEDHTGDADVLTWGKAYLKHRFDKPGNVFLGLVHRLDRPVSGVMLLARTSKAASRLSAQIRERAVSKRYIAAVQGRLEGEQTLRVHLRKDRDRTRIVGPGEAGAQQAELSFRSLWSSAAFSIVEIDLVTGRAHQIRTQLAHIGHPLAGDGRYDAALRFLPRRVALHASRFACAHPTRDEQVVLSALPGDWPEPFAHALVEVSYSE
jgi:23S rRNA-/tRNA-specific pseudouridylate synthase